MPDSSENPEKCPKTPQVAETFGDFLRNFGECATPLFFDLLSA
jgi:hypothetical protein